MFLTAKFGLKRVVVTHTIGLEYVLLPKGTNPFKISKVFKKLKDEKTEYRIPKEYAEWVVEQAQDDLRALTEHSGNELSEVMKELQCQNPQK